MPAIIYKNKNGERIPSVTTVLNQWGIKTQALLVWAWKRGEAGVDLREKEEANVGTLAHLRIDAEIKGKDIDLSQYPPNIVSQSDVCIDNWGRWKKAHKFQPIGSEISLVSEEHQYGGTIDIIGLIDGLLSILDIKTGKEIYEDHILQIVSYSKLWEKSFPEHPLKGKYHIIRLGKEIAMFSYNYYGEFPHAWEAFLMLRRLYDIHKEIKKLK